MDEKLLQRIAEALERVAKALELQNKARGWDPEQEGCIMHDTSAGCRAEPIDCRF